MIKDSKHIIVDCREFVAGRFTGISRVLEGLVDALAQDLPTERLLLASPDPRAVPEGIYSFDNVGVKHISSTFLKSEKLLSDLSKSEAKLFISPYRKLPLFGCYCKAINTVHDVLDITETIYRKQRIKIFLEKLRLTRDLKRADLTWYDSSWSLSETKNMIGLTGNRPRVRHLAIDERFYLKHSKEENVLQKYDLEPGYILVLGNGLPHKNLGILLRIAKNVRRPFVFVGVRQSAQVYWRNQYFRANGTWITHVNEADLPSIVSSAFCLAQPSMAEGYGYPPLEAMASGVPAVVSRIPVLMETTGANVLSADTDKPEQWIEAFEILENQVKYSELSKKGILWTQAFRGRDGWRKHVSDIKELLNDS